jgi:hypothetical protein
MDSDIRIDVPVERPGRKVDRREFLKLGVQGFAASVLTACNVPFQNSTEGTSVQSPPVSPEPYRDPNAVNKRIETNNELTSTDRELILEKESLGDYSQLYETYHQMANLYGEISSDSWLYDSIGAIINGTLNDQEKSKVIETLNSGWGESYDKARDESVISVGNVDITIDEKVDATEVQIVENLLSPFAWMFPRLYLACPNNRFSVVDGGGGAGSDRTVINYNRQALFHGVSSLIHETTHQWLRHYLDENVKKYHRKDIVLEYRKLEAEGVLDIIQKWTDLPINEALKFKYDQPLLAVHGIGEEKGEAAALTVLMNDTYDKISNLLPPEYDEAKKNGDIEAQYNIFQHVLLRKVRETRSKREITSQDKELIDDQSVKELVRTAMSEVAHFFVGPVQADGEYAGIIESEQVVDFSDPIQKWNYELQQARYKALGVDSYNDPLFDTRLRLSFGLAVSPGAMARLPDAEREGYEILEEKNKLEMFGCELIDVISNVERTKKFAYYELPVVESLPNRKMLYISAHDSKKGSEELTTKGYFVSVPKDWFDKSLQVRAHIITSDFLRFQISEHEYLDMHVNTPDNTFSIPTSGDRVQAAPIFHDISIRTELEESEAVWYKDAPAYYLKGDINTLKPEVGSPLALLSGVTIPGNRLYSAPATMSAVSSVLEFPGSVDPGTNDYVNGFALATDVSGTTYTLMEGTPQTKYNMIKKVNDIGYYTLGHNKVQTHIVANTEAILPTTEEMYEDGKYFFLTPVVTSNEKGKGSILYGLTIANSSTEIDGAPVFAVAPITGLDILVK